MRLTIAISVAVTVVVACPVARAEQFVLADVTYTHSTETTNDSHYYPELPADTPDDWTEPVDYAHGSVHIVLDVMTKPAGGAPTKLQICFEGTPSYACTLQSPTYTTTGRVEWDSPFASFWYESTVDWSQGTMRMPLILKDDMNNKPHGDPSYMPTDLRVQVTLVSAGATFAPPPSAGSGGSGGEAGNAGASGTDGGAGGAGGATTSGSGGSRAGTGGAAGAGGTAGAAGGGAAGTTSPRPSAGAGGASGQAAGSSGSSAAGGSAGVSSLPSSNAGNGALAGNSGARGTSDGSGCSSVGAGHGAPWWLVAVAGYLVARRRRRQRPGAHG